MYGNSTAITRFTIMKKIILLLIICCSTKIYAIAQEKSETENKQNIINIYNKPEFINNNQPDIRLYQDQDLDSRNTNQNTVRNMNMNQLIATITLSIHAWLQQQFVHIKSIDPQKYKDHIRTFLRTYKYPIIFYSFLGGYATTSIKLILDNHYLNRSDLWAIWKQDVSFEQLCNTSQHALGKELLLEIQRRYISQANLTDFLSPLIAFMNAVDYELKRIKKYLTITKWIERFHLMIIFPTNTQKIKKAEHLLQRLLFVKHIFLSWAAEYNITYKQPIKRWTLH